MGYKGNQGKLKGKGYKGNKKTQDKSKNVKDTKKELSDCVYYLGSAKQASDYETTTEYLINHVKKTFEYGNDIGTALMDLQEPDSDLWKPNMQVSVATDDDTKAAESRQYEIEFKADYDGYRARVLALENNKTKAYALLWERCSKGSYEEQD